jgi:hypothetical protein
VNAPGVEKIWTSVGCIPLELIKVSVPLEFLEYTFPSVLKYSAESPAFGVVPVAVCVKIAEFAKFLSGDAIMFN